MKITGVIAEHGTGDPIKGVQVYPCSITGTPQGKKETHTTTNVDGIFEFDLPDKVAFFAVKADGYKTHKQQINVFENGSAIGLKALPGE